MGSNGGSNGGRWCFCYFLALFGAPVKYASLRFHLFNGAQRMSRMAPRLNTLKGDPGGMRSAVVNEFHGVDPVQPQRNKNKKGFTGQTGQAGQADLVLLSQ